jgi:hypothetical protein
MPEDMATVEDHLVPLCGDWLLWRDFAVRSAGFPVSGLDVFGGPEEGTRLSEVAKSPDFAKAVIWQNRTAYRNAVLNLASDKDSSGSRRRQREALVAAYWQRYCSKNDTVGFFGPLAWGVVRDSGPALNVRADPLLGRSDVHFETWCLEALAHATAPATSVPSNRRPELDLRSQLAPGSDAKAIEALDRFEQARDRVRNASDPEGLLRELDAFDALFEETTGRPAERPDEAAEGGRTPLYLDCMRDLELDLGPPLVQELAASLPLLLEASRWWCGRTFEHAKNILGGIARDGPLAPQAKSMFDGLWRLPQRLDGDLVELQRRCAKLVQAGDDATVAVRAREAFADHLPAWPLALYQSADVQIAARDVGAIDRGEFLAVVGDFHPGNPLAQAVFSNRFPDVKRFRAMWHADLGSPMVQPLIIRAQGSRPTSRNIPDAADANDLHIVGPGLVMVHSDYPARDISEVLVRGGRVTDAAGSFDAPLVDLFFLPMMLAALRTFRPFSPSGPRITVGRTVLRRATWTVPLGDLPLEPEAIARWAYGLGLPRRSFCLPTGEAKPVYVDFESPLLTRNLHRMLMQAASADADGEARFSEMLPEPDQCWLEQNGYRYTCELRIVAVDRSRRGAAKIRM